MIRDFIASLTKINEFHRFKNKAGWKIILYLLVISLIFGFIFSTTIQNRYNKILLMIAENYDTNVPEFKIEDAQLKLTNEQKSVIEKDKGTIIFDVTGSYDVKSLDKYEYGLLFLKDKFVIKTSNSNVITRYWKDLNFEGYDKSTVRQMLGAIPALLILVTILSVVGLFLINIINSLLISLALLLAKRLWKKEITFSQLFKMSAHAMTLPTVLIAALSIVLGDKIGLTKYYYTYYLAVIYVLIALRRGEIKAEKSK